MLTTLSFTVDDSGNNGLGRPSFRDLASFNFQPQNIVANPNVLFYKADTVENRAKLRSILPYVLGAVSGETLAQRHELQRLQKELRKKEADLRNIQNLSERWRATIDARVSEAKDLGLIAIDAPIPANQAAAMDQLRAIASAVNADPLRERVRELERVISEAEIGQRLRRALSSVNLFAGRLMPLLDAETPNDPVSLSDTELTLKVQRIGREDFLWEIGSGSNWLSYHVAVTLGLHQFFLTLPSCPVPNFIVYDQPSQVYFPQRLAERKESEPASEPEWRDDDVEAVRKVFAAMSQAVIAASGNFQVIVLDHAAKSVWGGISLVHEVDEWRNGQALIPPDWMN